MSQQQQQQQPMEQALSRGRQAASTSAAVLPESGSSGSTGDNGGGGHYVQFGDAGDSYNNSNSNSNSNNSNNKPATPSPLQANNTFWVQACYMSLAAILGALLRIALAQLFGEECANPGTVGWLSAAAPLCVTKDGDSVKRAGGIIFADLPSNMLGSFLMGFLQDGTVLELAIHMAVAWLPPSHAFQHMPVLHLALKTGFCGSLTTFSSWNSEMVVIFFGTGSRNQATRISSALLGYIIGMETSLGSFACGKSVARRLHRMATPTLADEADAMRERREQGVYLNRELPDFERRFLHRYNMTEFESIVPIGQIESLERWRSTTESVRRVGHPLLPHLIEIEREALIMNNPRLPPHAESIAMAEGWDVASLREWIDVRSKQLSHLPSFSTIHLIPNGESSAGQSKWFTFPYAMALIFICMAALATGLVMLNGQHAHAITNRFMVYAMLCAPAGALLRWRLGTLNQKLPLDGWRWFPAGTFSANVLASILSIAAVALEYRLESLGIENFWILGTIRAIKVGFCGCLSTVSTFVAEVGSFMEKKTDHAYPYILATLGTSCVLSMLIYGIIISVL